MAAFIDRVQRVCGSRMLGWLLIVNCLAFLLLWITVMVGNSAGLSGNFTMQWLCVSSSAAMAVSHFWTVVTYMNVHYDFLHLLFNMLWLFWFGKILLAVRTERTLLYLYAGGGVTGALLYIAANALFPQFATGGYLCGASASVLSIMAGAAVFAPDMRLYLFLLGEVRLKWVAVGCILLTFLGMGGGNAGGQAAHIGGVVFGIAYALIVRRHAIAGMKSPQVVSGRRKVTLNVVSVPKRRNVVRDGNAVAQAASGKLSDANRLDALLDKIRLSGYSSLTDIERKELNALSQRLQND